MIRVALRAVCAALVLAGLFVPGIGYAQNAKKTPKAKAKDAIATDVGAGSKSVARPAAAAGAQQLGVFGDWGAYLGGSGSTKVCFVLSQPKDRQPKGLNRDPAYVFISFRPAQGVRNEVAVITGYAVKEGSQPLAVIGTANFGLLAKEQNAWLQNPAEESQFVQQAKAGANLAVRGTSLRGNSLTDIYSLKGFGSAIDAAQKECRGS